MKLFSRKYGHTASLQERLANNERQLSSASVFISQIESGKLDSEIPIELAETQIGRSLRSIKNHLQKLASEENQRSWLNEGLAKFSDILRNKDSLDLQHLSTEILTNIVRYVEANQGGLFILKKEENNEAYLDMIACYAYDRKKFLTKKIYVGDGLIGQCVLEKEIIYLREIPRDYVSITSGLGEATPREVLIAPLLINEEVFGVIELASFSEFP